MFSGITELVEWRPVGDSIELEFVTGAGNPLPTGPAPVVLVTLEQTAPAPQQIASELESNGAQYILNIGVEGDAQSSSVTIDGEDWEIVVKCRVVRQVAGPLQPRHYERVVNWQARALNEAGAESQRLREMISRVSTFLEQQRTRAERIICEAPAQLHNPRLRAEGRLRLAQELETLMSRRNDVG